MGQSAENTRLSLLDEIRLSLSSDRWNEFVAKYDELLTRWLRSQGVDVQDADEIKQRVLVHIVQELPSFEHSGNVGAFRNWLRKVMINRLREFWRARKKHQKYQTIGTLADALTNSRSELSIAWDREHNEFLIQSMLRKARVRFGKRNVEMFQRVTLNEEKPRDVAEDYAVTLGALRVTQHRILKELRNYGKGIVF